jgi:hypothetical protein
MMKYLVSVVILILALAGVLNAQTPSKQETEPANQESEFGKRLDAYIKESEQKNANTAPPDSIGGTVPPQAELFLIMEKLDQLDPPTKQKVLASFDEYLNYRISGYQHRREVFQWQLYSSKITFYVVIFLVLAGVYFSGIQFHRSMGQRRPRVVADKEVTQVVSTGAEEVTEITATLKGIKVSSPVLGILILVISLAFFYLYLRYVYPIEEIF